MPWARASALDRHMACPASSHLPRLDRGVWALGYLQTGELVAPPGPIELKDTTAADWGTAMHSAKSNDATASDPWLTLMDPFRDAMWPTALGVHEQAVAYDCRTREVKLGPVNLPVDQMNAWKAAQSDDSVVGTADWWGALPTGEPWIDDLKTGWRTPEVLTPQMLFYAMCHRLEAKANSCRVSITHFPRAASEPTREGLWRQAGPVTLDNFQDELHHAWVRAVGFNASAKPGPHCHYCASALVCDRAND